MYVELEILVEGRAKSKCAVQELGRDHSINVSVQKKQLGRDVIS